MIKTYFLLFIMLGIPLFLNAQAQFSQGYLVLANGQKQSCQLKNRGAEGKGEDYIYRLSKNDSIRPVSVEKIREFGIENSRKFVREFIELDISGNRIKSYEEIGKNLNVEKGYAFLQERIESDDASLYSFQYEGEIFFFYRRLNAPVNFLIYKQYELQVANLEITEVIRDQRFRDQLEADLPCSVDAQKVEYRLEDLMEYFAAYINETGGHYKKLGMPTKAKVGIKITTAYNHSSYFLSDETMQQDFIDFGNQNRLSYGMGIEYLFKRHRNKLGIYGETNYSSFSSLVEHDPTGEVSEIDYKYIEFPTGILYRMNMGEETSLFIKAGVVPNLVLKGSYVSRYIPGNTEELNSALNSMIGGGIEYKMINLEVRYYSPRDITMNIYNHGSRYNQVSIRLSLSISDLLTGE